jgi:methylated-DNA-protein-cysteine methyltransferase-like protein
MVAKPVKRKAREARIPRGRMSTYGELATVAGLPRRARLVGSVLKHMAAKMPWPRVLNAGGRISLPAGSTGYLRQRAYWSAKASSSAVSACRC